jgi:formyl-CoA transferase
MSAALDGVIVVDFTQFQSGPTATEHLAWLGATVIKVERPRVGEQARRFPGDPPGMDSHSFLLLNMNKKSVTIDVKTSEGSDLVRRLIDKADVFIENYGPGVIERLCLDYDNVRKINPRVIYAQIKGFGSDGPYAGISAFDPIGVASGGGMAATGEMTRPEQRMGGSADTVAAYHCVMAILAALYQRDRTGEGQRIEIAMQDVIVSFQRQSWQPRLALQPPPKPGAGWTTAPHGFYPCKGGGPNDYVYVFTSRWAGSRDWEGLLRAIGREDLIGDERYSAPRARYDRQDEVNALVADWTQKHTKLEAMEILGKHDVPTSAIMSLDDIAADQYLRRRGIVEEIHHPQRGKVVLPGDPIKMTGSHVEIRPSPLLGASNQEIFGDLLGLSEAELKELSTGGII